MRMSSDDALLDGSPTLEALKKSGVLPCIGRLQKGCKFKEAEKLVEGLKDENNRLRTIAKRYKEETGKQTEPLPGVAPQAPSTSQPPPQGPPCTPPDDIRTILREILMQKRQEQSCSGTQSDSDLKDFFRQLIAQAGQASGKAPVGMDSNSRDLEAARSELSTVQAQLAAARTQIQELKSQLETAQTLNGTQTAQIADLGNRLSHCESVITEYIKANEALKAQIAESGPRNDQSTEVIDQMTALLNKGAQTTNEAKDKQITELRAEVDRLQKNLKADETPNLKKLQDDSGRLVKLVKLTGLVDETSRQAEIDNLRAQVAALSAGRSGSTAADQTEIQNLRGQLGALGVQLDALRAQGAASVDCSKVEATYQDKMKTLIGDHVAEIKVLKAHKEEAIAIARAVVTELEELKTQHDLLRDKFEQDETEDDDTETDNTETSYAVQTLQEVVHFINTFFKIQSTGPVTNLLVNATNVAEVALAVSSQVIELVSMSLTGGTLKQLIDAPPVNIRDALRTTNITIGDQSTTMGKVIDIGIGGNTLEPKTPAERFASFMLTKP